MSTFRLFISAVRGQFQEGIAGIRQPIARAATAAIRQAGEDVKREARGGIAAAGFSKRWQNALRVDVYPRRGESMAPAAHIFHKIPYAGVFERGANISGRPFLWLPLSGTPTRAAGKRLTPRQYVASIGPLHTISRPGKPPLLGGRIREGASGKLTPGKLRSGQRHAERGKATMSVPLFVGVPIVKIRARFGVMAAVERARGKLGLYYLQNLKE